MKKRFPLATGVALAAALTLSACAGSVAPGATPDGDSAPGQLEEMTMGVFPGSFFAIPEYVGLERGIYEKHGIDLSLVDIPSGPGQTSALASGSVDMIGSTPGNVTLANVEGLDLKFLSNYYERTFYTWIAREGLDAPHQGDGYPDSMLDLKGLKVGVPVRGAEAELVTNLVLRDIGLDPDTDVTWVAVTAGTAGVSALQGAQIDVLVSIEPVTTLILDQLEAGTAMLDLRTGEEGPELMQQYPGQGRVARASELEKQAELFGKWQAAWDEIMTFIADPANADEVAEIYAERSGLDLDLAKKTIAANQGNFTSEYSCDRHEVVATVLAETGQITAQQAADSATCEEFLWSGYKN